MDPENILNAVPRELNSADLHLRPMEITDEHAMFTMLSDAQTVKYWSNEPLLSADQARQKLEENIQSDAQGNSICWAICKKHTDKMIGYCVLFQFSQANRRAEIGFMLNRSHWRQGMMYQALRAIVEFAFARLDLHRLEADVDPANTGSLRLLEKLGFEREGLFRERWLITGQWRDSVMLGLIQAD